MTSPDGPRRPVVRLVPVTAQWAGRIEHWFTDAEVVRRLGHPAWIHRAAAMIGAPTDGETFHGSRVLRVHGWVGLDLVGAPVGYVGGDVYDRWARPDGADSEERTSMGLAFVVDPTRWRQGWGTALLKAAVAHSDVTDVAVFFLGIEDGNTASRRTAARAGFTRVDDEPDGEGIVYWRRSR